MACILQAHALKQVADVSNASAGSTNKEMRRKFRIHNLANLYSDLDDFIKSMACIIQAHDALKQVADVSDASAGSTNKEMRRKFRIHISAIFQHLK
jgi:hypothetical protein